LLVVHDAEGKAVIKTAALKKMTTKALKSCDIYVRAGRIKNKDAANIAKELGAKNITKLKGTAKEDFNRPLDMCVSIVIDQVGTKFY
jgi:hypothetical protein